MTEPQTDTQRIRNLTELVLEILAESPQKAFTQKELFELVKTRVHELRVTEMDVRKAVWSLIDSQEATFKSGDGEGVEADLEKVNERKRLRNQPA